MKINKYSKGMNADGAFMEKEEIYDNQVEWMEKYGPKPDGVATALRWSSEYGS